MEAVIPTTYAFNATESYSTETTPYGSPTTDYYDYPIEDFGMCKYVHHGRNFIPALYAIFFILGLLGNSLVIWVIACGVRIRSMTDVCLLNLAIADLLLVCSLPFFAHQAQDQWHFGDPMCKIVLGIYHIVFYCGIFFISLMSIDRYLAIVHAVCAIKARTRTFGTIAAVVTWLAGFLASFPDVLFLKVQSNNQTLSCYPDFPTGVWDDPSSQKYHFWKVFSLLKMNILGLLVPLLIMGFCYSQIICKLRSSQSSKTQRQSPKRKSSSSFKRQRQAIHVVIIVVIVFVCCWVPYNVASFFKALEMMQIYTQCNSSKAIFLALHITEAIAYSHSCLNPILYVFVGQKFRRHLQLLMNRAPCRVCQVIKVNIPQDRTSVHSQTTSLDERSTAV